jgi:hypothetical protein
MSIPLLVDYYQILTILFRPFYLALQSFDLDLIKAIQETDRAH